MQCLAHDEHSGSATITFIIVSILLFACDRQSSAPVDPYNSQKILCTIAIPYLWLSCHDSPVSPSAPWAENILRQNWWHADGNLNCRQDWGPWKVLLLLSGTDGCFSSCRWLRCSASQSATPTPYGGLLRRQSVGDALSLPSIKHFSPTDSFHLPTQLQKAQTQMYFLAVVRCLGVLSSFYLYLNWGFTLSLFLEVHLHQLLSAMFCGSPWDQLVSKCLGDISIPISIKHGVFDWGLEQNIFCPSPDRQNP